VEVTNMNNMNYEIITYLRESIHKYHNVKHLHYQKLFFKINKKQLHPNNYVGFINGFIKDEFTLTIEINLQPP
jgi:hypothetical protein